MTLLPRVSRCASRLASCFRRDSRLLVRAFLWRLSLPVLKYVFPLPTLVRIMAAKPAGAETDEQRQARIESLRRLLADGGRLAVSSNCLERSLMLYRFLSEAGASPHLVMGVSTGVTGVAGHAWIELDGQPLADATTAGFVPILAYGAGGLCRSSPDGKW